MVDNIDTGVLMVAGADMPDGEVDKTLPGFEKFSADFCEVHPTKKTDIRRSTRKKIFNRLIIFKIFYFFIFSITLTSFSREKRG
jgi:hypothetical protein